MTKIGLYSMALCMLMLFSCEEERAFYEGENFVVFDAGLSSVAENATSPLTVKIIRSSGAESATVDYSVSSFYTEDSTQSADATFTLSDASSITFAAGELVKEVTLTPIDNSTNDGNKVINITLTNISTAGVSVGLPGAAQNDNAFSITIADDDCAFPSLVGTYTSLNSAASPGGCSGRTFSVDITLVSTQNASLGQYTYKATDITGGLYGSCYGDGVNPGNFTTDGFSITMTDQPDVVYGGDVFNGTGNIECDGSFTIDWSNGFGDAALSSYSK
jgi:hypothetical protein